jgi:hypothetical protein
MISECDIKDLMFHNETGGYPLFQKKKNLGTISIFPFRICVAARTPAPESEWIAPRTKRNGGSQMTERNGLKDICAPGAD